MSDFDGPGRLMGRFIKWGILLSIIILVLALLAAFWIGAL